MNTLPIVLKNSTILLIGGGKVALQKARVMSDNNINFKVITKNTDENMISLSGGITIKAFETNDLEGFGIVIDATGDPEVAEKLMEYKKQNTILLNVVDRPELCDFYFAALVKRGLLKVAVSSSGASPTIA